MKFENSNAKELQRTYKSEHTRRKKRLKKVKILGSLAAVFFILALGLLAYYFMFKPERITLQNLLVFAASPLLTALLSTIFVNTVCDLAWGEYESDELSSHIASTLVGNMDVLSEFSPDTRRRFITNTISTLTGEEDAEMISGFLNPYLTGRYNTRKNQFYQIHVLPSLIDCKISNISFPAKKYTSVEESLEYTKHYAQRILTAEENHFPQDFYIYFCLRPEDTHAMHNDSACMFRENLYLAQEEAAALSGLSEDHKMEFVQKYMNLQLTVGDAGCNAGAGQEIRKLTITKEGIRIDYHLESRLAATDVRIRLRFTMPCLARHLQFVIQFGEPTFGSNVSFVYPRDSGLTSSIFMTGSKVVCPGSAVQNRTSWTMQLCDQWIYPMSGIVFSLELPERSDETPAPA